jgi:hypothetical protein
MARTREPVWACSAIRSRGVRDRGHDDESNGSVGWVGIASDLVVVATLKPETDRRTYPERCP